MRDKQIISLKEFMLEKFSNLEKSTELARLSMEKRLEGMNEFRDTLRDQASKFITRAELNVMVSKFDQEIARLIADIRILRESDAKKEGKASQLSTNIALLIAIIGILISIFNLLIKG